MSPCAAASLKRHHIWASRNWSARGGVSVREADLPIGFSTEPYTRIVLHRDESIEVVLICFAAGQRVRSTTIAAVIA